CADRVGERGGRARSSLSLPRLDAPHGRGELLAPRPEAVVHRLEGDAERICHCGTRGPIEVVGDEGRAPFEIERYERLSDQLLELAGLHEIVGAWRRVGWIDVVTDRFARVATEPQVVGRHAKSDAEEPRAQRPPRVVEMKAVVDDDEHI